MDQLQDAIAWAYPNQYTAQSWQELLPQFVIDQLKEHQKAIDAYQQQQASWQQGDQTTPAPEVPLPSDLLGYACEVYAKNLGLTFQTVAFCMFLAEEKALLFKQQSDWLRTERDYYKQLWEGDQKAEALMED